MRGNPSPSIAVLCVLVAVLAVLAGRSTGWAQSKNLHYNGFTCDVYGGQAARVMDNDGYNLAYDFNVTELAAGSYVAVFHAEPYRKAAGCWGDSVAVRYASSPDGTFGNRTGDCDDCPGDTVISRTSSPSDMMSSPDCSGLGGLSGGGNPILLQRQGTPAWTLFYLSVSDYDEAAGAHNDWWRHYLMVAHPADVTNMLGCDWAALANNGTADYWHWFTAQPPKWQDYQPWPARLHSNGALLQSTYEAYQSANTQGLIGSMSYDAALGTIYYFYIDIVNGQNVTRRQQMVDLTSVNWWHDPVTIRTDWVNAAFHAGRGLWAVMSNCYDVARQGWDVCLQFTPSDSVSDIDTLPASDQVAHGLGLAEFFNDPVTGGIMEQYGFLKNPYGQIPGDDFRIYVGERSASGAAGGLYDMDMYSVRVSCHCDTTLCGGQCCTVGQVCSGGFCCTPDCSGRECGDDGCGGSCGACGTNASCSGGQCQCDGQACGDDCCAAGEVCSGGLCCAPDCSGRECGDDACGGACGACGLGFTCNVQGVCTPDSCEMDCTGRSCGPDPLCGLSCGSCDASEICDASGQCVCAGVECQGACCGVDQVCFEAACCSPDCSGRDCGDDGCGGSCGGCSSAEQCNLLGHCVPEDCAPECGDRVCGPDPVCGLSCGACGEGATCSDQGRCVATTNGTASNGCGCAATPGLTGALPTGLLVLFLLWLRWRPRAVRARGLARQERSSAGLPAPE